MARYRFIALSKATTPRYLVVWDLAWTLIDCQRLPPASDLCSAMTAAIARLAGDGWEPEGETEYGFVFIRRESERRLLMLTKWRCPHCARLPWLRASASSSPSR
jgi:hypothetical protein